MTSDAMKSLHELLKFSMVIVILIGVFSIWSWWEVRSVRGFCAAVKRGTPVLALSAIAETHHQDTHWLGSSEFDKEKGTWNTWLPTRSTFGEVGCRVEHDKREVLSSKMVGD